MLPKTNEPENYMNIIEEMEQNILKNSVIHIFDLIERVKHKIIKVSHEVSLKQIWDMMMEDHLTMAALESEPETENNFNPSSHKIPSCIQGFITHIDFLKYFLDNFEGDVKPFERTLQELDFDYAMNQK